MPFSLVQGIRELWELAHDEGFASQRSSLGLTVFTEPRPMVWRSRSIVGPSLAQVADRRLPRLAVPGCLV